MRMTSTSCPLSQSLLIQKDVFLFFCFQFTQDKKRLFFYRSESIKAKAIALRPNLHLCLRKFETRVERESLSRTRNTYCLINLFQQCSRNTHTAKDNYSNHLIITNELSNFHSNNNNRSDYNGRFISESSQIY